MQNNPVPALIAFTLTAFYCFFLALFGSLVHRIYELLKESSALSRQCTGPLALCLPCTHIWLISEAHIWHFSNSGAQAVFVAVHSAMEEMAWQCLDWLANPVG